MKYSYLTKLFVFSYVNFVLGSGVVTETIKYSLDDLSFSKTKDGYDIISFNDAVFSGTTGDPQIPSIHLKFVIPANHDIEKVEIVEQKCDFLPGIYKIIPVQEPVTFSLLSTRKFEAWQSHVYSMSTFFPSKNIEVVSTTNMGGFKIAGLVYYPLQYMPLEGKVQLTTSIQIRLHHKSTTACSGMTLSERQYEDLESIVKKTVKNTEDVKKCSPATRATAINDVNYAIITDNAFVSEFDALKNWKTKKGYKAEVFSTTWIYNNYSGYDNAEKIRNFLIEYHKNRGLIYVLLAGDYDKVPERDLNILIPMGANPHDGMVASDFYYSDLDGTWDSNNNHKYGEIGYDKADDEIDGLADVFVGRAPVDNIEDVRVFIHKDTTAEKHPETSHQKKFLLISSPVNGGKHLQNLSDTLRGTTTSGWYTPSFYYDNIVSRNCVFDSLSKGFSLCHIGSHGNDDKFLAEGNKTMFDISDAGKLTNGNKLFTLFSMACLVGSFDIPDKDCIAEELMNNANGGSVALILNSREGLGDVDAVQMKLIHGFSERLCIEFNSNFFKRNEHVVGKCHALTRNTFRDYAWKNTDTAVSFEKKYAKWAWSISEWNLFGDPDLPIFKDVPLAMSLNSSNAIPMGVQEYIVKVTDSNGPVSGALVCCYKGDEVYVTGKTNESGLVTLTVNPRTNGGMFVTATASDHTPCEGTCTIGSVSINNGEIDGLNKSSEFISKSLNGQYFMQFYLSKTTDVKINIFNASGKIVKRFFSGNSGQGLHAMDIGNLDHGVYIVKLSIGHNQKSQKLIVVK